MADTDALAAFRQGVDLLQNGYAEKAIAYFRSAAEAEKRNPYYLSFLGVSVGRGQKKWETALKLCEAAIDLKRDEPQFYLNLAEVHVSAGRRDEAIEVLDTAVSRFGLNARIQKERKNLGKRGNRVLSFLPREHFLNRNLGNLRHKALKRIRKKKEA